MGMSFRIVATLAFAWPDESTVSKVLDAFGLSLGDLHSALRSFTDQTAPDVDRYTETLATSLAHHLAQSLARDGNRATTRQTTNRYSSGLDHHADLVLALPDAERRLFFEVEFRPN